MALHRYSELPTFSGVFSGAHLSSTSGGGMSPVWYTQAGSSWSTLSRVICLSGE